METLYTKEQMESFGFSFPEEANADVTFMSKTGLVFDFYTLDGCFNENITSDIYCVAVNGARDPELYEPKILFWHYGAEFLKAFNKDTVDDLLEDLRHFESLILCGTIHI